MPETETFKIPTQHDIMIYNCACIGYSHLCISLHLKKSNSFIILLKDKVVDSYHFIKLPVHDLFFLFLFHNHSLT